jgi:hypothetical protein
VAYWPDWCNVIEAAHSVGAVRVVLSASCSHRRNSRYEENQEPDRESEDCMRWVSVTGRYSVGERPVVYTGCSTCEYVSGDVECPAL